MLLALVLAVGIVTHRTRGSSSPRCSISPPRGSRCRTWPIRHALHRFRVPAGRWYLLNVWGAWCVECRAEHEMLLKGARLRARSADRPRLEGRRRARRRGSAQLGNPYEVVAVDRNGRAAIDWGRLRGTGDLPRQPAGIVVYKHVGALDDEQSGHVRSCRALRRSREELDARPCHAGGGCGCWRPPRRSRALDTTQLADPALQARYVALTHELRCMQCQNGVDRSIPRGPGRGPAQPGARTAAGRQVRR